MSTAAASPKPSKAKRPIPKPTAAKSPKPKTPKRSASAAPKATGSGGKISANVRDASSTLKLISDPTRLAILLILIERSVNVGDICLELGGVAQPAVSHHLALLRHGRMIVSERSGKNNFYSLTEPGRELAKVAKAMTS